MKEAYGNELHEGDWVLCHINKMIRLKVIKIEEPGKLSVPNGDAGQLGYIASQWTAIDPIQKGQDRMPSLYKTSDPEEGKRVEKILDNLNKVPIPIKQ